MMMKSLSRCQQLGSLLLGVALCVFLVGCGATKVNKANYDKVKQGMTEAQVIDILGAPTDTKPSMGGGKLLIWKSGTNIVNVTFLKDKVIGKMSNLDPLGS
jgi:SmpA / OmlA family